MKQLLKSNGFPVKYLNKHCKIFLNNKMNVNNIIKCDVYGPEKKCIFKFTLLYPKLSQKISQIG